MNVKRTPTAPPASTAGRKRGRPSGSSGKAPIAITEQFLDLLDDGVEPLWATRMVAGKWGVTESTVRRYRYRYEPTIARAIDEETDAIFRQAARQACAGRGTDFPAWFDAEFGAYIDDFERRLVARGAAPALAAESRAHLYTRLFAMAEVALGRLMLDLVARR